MLGRTRELPELSDWLGVERAPQTDDQMLHAMQVWAAVTKGLQEGESAE